MKDDEQRDIRARLRGARLEAFQQIKRRLEELTHGPRSDTDVVVWLLGVAPVEAEEE
jgi:hypothetical protein